MSSLHLLFVALLFSPVRAESLLQGPALTQDDAAPVELAVEYERLHSRYANDLENWSIEERKLLGQGVPKSQLPKHPGFEYQPSFADLAERGCPDARLWMVQNPAFHGAAGAARRAVLSRWYEALVKENSDDEVMLNVIEELSNSKRRLGEEFVLAAFAEIAERSQNPEFIVLALYHRGWLMSDGMATKDPERRAGALELFSIIILGYPDSKEAAKAAGLVYRVESNDLRAALHEWCDQCRALLAKGESPEKWPVNPMHLFQPRMAVLAAAGSGQAQQWTAEFYPAFDQRDRRARDLGALWLGQEFSNRRSASERVWMDLKFDILDLACDVSAEAAWAFDLVKGLDEEVAFFFPDRYAPVLRKVIELTTDLRVREQARLTLARSLSRGKTFGELSEAASLFRDLEVGATVERIGKEAEEHLEALERVMPGVLAPKLVGKDAEGLEVDLEEYRGKVLVLWFWSFTRQEESHFEEIDALRERLDGEEFAFLGVNCDLRSPKSFRRDAKQHAITWRNTLQHRPTGHMTQAYGVYHWPTAFVIDAEGVLRGRSIDLKTCEELVRALVEAEK